MGMIIGILVVLAILLFISIFFPAFKYTMLALFSIAQLISLFTLDTVDSVLIYGILGALSYMFLLGAMCFDLEDKAYTGVILEIIGNTIYIKPEEPHPIAAFLGNIIGSIIASGGFVLVCIYVFDQPIIMPVVSGIVLLLSIISLIQHIFFARF